MQVKYNSTTHPVKLRFEEFQQEVYQKYKFWCGYTKSRLKTELKDTSSKGSSKHVKDAIKAFLEEPLIKDFKGEYLQPTLKESLTDMKGRPMQLGTLFIQNASRKLSTYIVTSVGKTGGARVNRLEDKGDLHWSPYMHGSLLTLPKPEYYLIVEPSFLSDEQKEVLEKVFEIYPLCKQGYEEVYGRS